MHFDSPIRPDFRFASRPFYVAGIGEEGEKAREILAIIVPELGRHGSEPSPSVHKRLVDPFQGLVAVPIAGISGRTKDLQCVYPPAVGDVYPGHVCVVAAVECILKCLVSGGAEHVCREGGARGVRRVVGFSCRQRRVWLICICQGIRYLQAVWRRACRRYCSALKPQAVDEVVIVVHEEPYGVRV